MLLVLAKLADVLGRISVYIIFVQVEPFAQPETLLLQAKSNALCSRVFCQ